MGIGAPGAPRRRKVRLYLAALLPLSIVLQWAASAAPEVVERLYSRALYPALVRAAVFLTGWFPFSLAELLVAFVGILVISTLVRAAMLLLRKQRKLRDLLLNGLLNGLAAAGLLYGLALLMWVLNYQRVPFAVSAELDTSPAALSELRSLCESLVIRANALREDVEEDGQGVMRLQDTRWGALQRAHLGFDTVGELYDVLQGRLARRPKGVIASPLLTALGIPGFYFPYTGEPNVNTDLPQHTFPYNACHELAHQIGFAGEDEAGFIGYLACSVHPDADFRYSATMRALLYAMRALAREDRDAYDELYSSCSAGVRRDWKAAQEFWRKHATRARRQAYRAVDVHLRSQGRVAGLKSYGQMVDLLIAEQRERKIKSESW